MKQVKRRETGEVYDYLSYKIITNGDYNENELMEKYCIKYLVLSGKQYGDKVNGYMIRLWDTGGEYDMNFSEDDYLVIKGRGCENMCRVPLFSFTKNYITIDAKGELYYETS